MKTKRFHVTLTFNFDHDIDASQLPHLVLQAMTHPIMPKGHVLVVSQPEINLPVVKANYFN